jgi:hypothetical protein
VKKDVEALSVVEEAQRIGTRMSRYVEYEAQTVMLMAKAEMEKRKDLVHRLVEMLEWEESSVLTNQRIKVLRHLAEMDGYAVARKEQ